MSRIALVMLLTVILTSCVQESGNEHSNPFSGKYLAAGDECYFDKDWNQQFECDCCYDEVYFNSDSTFYYYLTCLNSFGVMDGSYTLVEDRLIMNFTGKYCEKEYNELFDDDSSQVEYIYFDTILPVFTRNWLIDTLGTKVTLTCNHEKTPQKALVIPETQISWYAPNELEERINNYEFRH